MYILPHPIEQITAYVSGFIEIHIRGVNGAALPAGITAQTVWVSGQKRDEIPEQGQPVTLYVTTDHIRVTFTSQKIEWLAAQGKNPRIEYVKALNTDTETPLFAQEVNLTGSLLGLGQAISTPNYEFNIGDTTYNFYITIGSGEPDTFTSEADLFAAMTQMGDAVAQDFYLIINEATVKVLATRKSYSVYATFDPVPNPNA